MPPQVQPGGRRHRRHQGAQIVDEGGDTGERDGDVQLERDVERVHRRRVPLPVGPQALPVRGGGGDDRVQHAGGGLDRRGEVAGRVGGPDALHQQVRGVRRERPAGERGRPALVGAHQVDAVAEDQLDGVQGGHRGPQGGDEADRGGQAGHGEQSGCARRRQPDQPQLDLRDDAQGAFAADEQRWQVVTDVVLGQAGQPPQHAAVGQHHLQPGHLAAGHPVAQHPLAAGVGRGDAADGGRAAGGEVDADAVAGRARVRLDVGEGRPGTGRHQPGGGVHRLERGEPAQAEQHRPGRRAGRHRTADQAGVAALGHHGHAVPGADPQHGGDLFGRRGTGHGRGPPPEGARPVGFVAHGHIRVGEDVGGAEHADEICDQHPSIMLGRAVGSRPRGLPRGAGGAGDRQRPVPPGPRPAGPPRATSATPAGQAAAGNGHRSGGTGPGRPGRGHPPPALFRRLRGAGRSGISRHRSVSVGGGRQRSWRRHGTASYHQAVSQSSCRGRAGVRAASPGLGTVLSCASQ